MSNDLISRKVVFADDVCRYIKTEINPYGKPFHGSAYELGLKIVEHIEKMSAAYDVNNIIEKLEEQRAKKVEQLRVCCDKDMEDYLRCKMSGIAEAIEIVKAGGVDD